MATLWDVIVSNSTAVDGSTFWEHLNSQNTGTGTGTVIIGGDLKASISLSLTANMDNNNLVASIDPNELTAVNGEMTSTASIDFNNEATI